MAPIRIELLGDRIVATTPFHPAFPAKARALGGRCHGASKTWVFDARDEQRVRAIVRQVYGTDDSSSAAVLTLRCQLDEATVDDRATSLWFCGREIARTFGRDDRPKLGSGVVVLAGGFRSGGSRKNFGVITNPGTIVEIRDVPEAAAREIHGECYGVALLDASGAVVAEATHPESPDLGPDAPDVSESDALATAIAEAEGRLAGLRFRAAELAEAAT